MKHTPLGLGSVCLLAAALSVLSSCKRDLLLSPPAGAPQEAAVTSSDLYSGTPHIFPVRMAVTSTFAGGPTAGLFRQPTGVAGDKDGNIYVADRDNNMVKKFSAAGTLLNFWGDRSASYRDGSGPFNVAFHAPTGVAVGLDGRVFVADALNHRIRVISADGKSVSTLAGNGQATYRDGQGTAASFNQPVCIAVDPSGALFVADYGNNMIRRVSSTGLVARYAGQTISGRVDGPLLQASFNGPHAITIAPGGIIYVADQVNNKIRKIASGSVSTFAGSGTAATIDGTGAGASFTFPTGVAADASGNLYVVEGGNSPVRFITPAGVVRTVAGGVRNGYVNSYDINSQFSVPQGIGIDFLGNVFVADFLNQAVRKVIFALAVKTLAGNGSFGYREGGGFGAVVEGPSTIAVGPDGNAYAMDAGSRIRKITPGGVTSLVAGNGVWGFRDGPAAQAQFQFMVNLAIARDGTIYVADGINNRVRKIKNGQVTTLAGSGNYADVEGRGASASMAQPQAIAVGPDGNIYVTSNQSGWISKITPDGILTHIFRMPLLHTGYPVISSMAIDARGSLYLASNRFHSVWKYTPGNPSQNTLYGGVDNAGRPFHPEFNPEGITLSSSGVIYVSEITKIDKLLTTQAPSTLVRLAGSDVAGALDAPVLNATFNDARSIAYGSTGILYVADYNNNKVRMLSAQ